MDSLVYQFWICQDWLSLHLLRVAVRNEQDHRAQPVQESLRVELVVMGELREATFESCSEALLVAPTEYRRKTVFPLTAQQPCLVGGKTWNTHTGFLFHLLLVDQEMLRYAC